MPQEKQICIKILLADDQSLFADNLKLMLETLSEDISVTGIASTGQEAIELAGKEQPDIVLMDVSMPVLDGVEATRILHQQFPGIKIVILTTFPDDSYVKDALHYGAYGYILKNMDYSAVVTLRPCFVCRKYVLSCVFEGVRYEL